MPAAETDRQNPVGAGPRRNRWRGPPQKSGALLRTVTPVAEPLGWRKRQPCGEASSENGGGLTTASGFGSARTRMGQNPSGARRELGGWAVRSLPQRTALPRIYISLGASLILGWVPAEGWVPGTRAKVLRRCLNQPDPTRRLRRRLAATTSPKFFADHRSEKLVPSGNRFEHLF